MVEANPHVECFLPGSYPGGVAARNVRWVDGPLEIRPDILSTGELSGVEQSLVLRTGDGVVVLTGCSHPGVGRIIEAASAVGDVRGIIGGLHGFRDLALLDSMPLICPCHCTVYRGEMRPRYGRRYLEGGVGVVVDLE